MSGMNLSGRVECSLLRAV